MTPRFQPEEIFRTLAQHKVDYVLIGAAETAALTEQRCSNSL